jgi:hypothetical protein
MSHSPFRSGIIAALVLGICALIYFNLGLQNTLPASPVIIHIASSTVLVKNSVTITSSPTVPVQKISVKKITPTTSTPAVPTAPTQSAADINAELAVSASSLRNALVNIICSVPSGSQLRSISGSGIIVDPKGIILTNAHVAQYFLLSDRGISCVIRSGSPASNSYDAVLEYISPAWINANPNVLTESEPTGTGEHDFAFLAITKSAATASLPTAFSYIPLAIMPPDAQTPIAIASYGAQFIQTNQISSDLFPTIVYGSIKNVFTFGTNTVDVLSLGGSAAAQEGSSGGGVADASGNLVGTITTSTITGATDTRSLNAITASYIRADYASETGQPLDLLLAESTPTAVANFAPRISSLEAIITAQLH